MMWARVKGRTENALLALSPRTYMFRPGLIIPLHGIRSRTGWYNLIYSIAMPLYPIIRRWFPAPLRTPTYRPRHDLGRARGIRQARARDSDINSRHGQVRDVLRLSNRLAAARIGTQAVEPDLVRVSGGLNFARVQRGVEPVRIGRSHALANADHCRGIACPHADGVAWTA